MRSRPMISHGSLLPCRQSCLARERTMLRLLLFIHLVHHTCTYVTDLPSFAIRLDKLYEKLEKLTVAPPNKDSLYIPSQDLLAKIDKLNSLNPEKDWSEDDEDLLAAMQTWGMLSAEQLESVVKDLHELKAETQNEKLTDGEYADAEWMDEEIQDLGEGDYPMDAIEEWDDVELEGSTNKPPVITPSAFTRQEVVYRETLSAADSITATNERPKILDDSYQTPIEKAALRRAALAHIGSVVRSSKCFTPQPRWLSVRQLAPAADTVYMPPCVHLHRCAPDSGCCYNEGEVCAPVAGDHINIPFFLNKADGNLTVARMRFFNHTRCACVSRDTLQSNIRSTGPRQVRRGREHPKEHVVREVQNEWRSTEEPRLEKDEESTAPPQLRRCTCPGLFLARMAENGVCSCICDWPDPYKRRDCLSLARGREHFGLRDRVCVAHGDCNPPACEYGAYEKSNGRCPLRRYRRARYHRARFDKAIRIE